MTGVAQPQSRRAGHLLPRSQRQAVLFADAEDHRWWAAVCGRPRQRRCRASTRARGQSRVRRVNADREDQVHYRNPDGSARTSRRCRRRTRWGWTTSQSTRARSERRQLRQGLARQNPAHRREDRHRSANTLLPAPSRRRASSLDERRVTVVAPRFDGYIDKVGPVTSGTHVKQGRTC